MIIKVGEKYFGIDSIEAENINHNRIRVNIVFRKSENLMEVAYHFKSNKEFFKELKEFNITNIYESKYKNIYKDITEETNHKYILELIFYNETQQTQFILNLFKDFDINNCNYSKS
jgi:hypothetical protein